MKQYPSIPHFNPKSQIEKMYIFDKIDGSNLRFEWSKSRSWYKAGTRTQLLSPEDPIFGPAIPLFKETLADPLEKIALDLNWLSVVVFAEYAGSLSFAGKHVPGDQMSLSLIDIAPYKKGVLSPEEFLELTEGLNRAKFLGIHDFDKDFVLSIKIGAFDNLYKYNAISTREGIVAKKKINHEIIMFKAKTQNWIDRVRGTYDSKIAELLVNN